MFVKNEKYVSLHSPLSHDREHRVSATDWCRQEVSSTRASVSSVGLQPSSVFVAGSGSGVIPHLVICTIRVETESRRFQDSGRCKGQSRLLRYMDRRLIHRWNAEAGNVCDVQRAHHVRGASP